MDLVFRDEDFPLWLTAASPVTDEQLAKVREANPLLSIDREHNGKLHIRIKWTLNPRQ